MQQVPLDLFFPDKFTGEIIPNGVKEALSAWGLDEDHLVCVTTNSGSNIVQKLKINRWTRLFCFGHRLHSAIGKFLKNNLPSICAEMSIKMSIQILKIYINSIHLKL